MNWFVKKGSEESGPYSREELINQYREGLITDKTFVRSADSTIAMPFNQSGPAEDLGIAVKEVMDDDGNAMKLAPQKVKPLGWRTKFLLGTFGAYVLIALGILAMNIFFAIAIIQGNGQLTPEMIESPLGGIMLAFSQFAVPLSIAAFVISAVAYGVFFHQAMANVRFLGATEATMKPWTVWAWHFVPFASLWMPLKAMTQIWGASLRLSKSPDTGNIILGAWWLSWLIGIIGSRIYDTVTSGPEPSIADLPGLLAAEAVIVVFMITSAVMVMLIGQRLDRAHKAFGLHEQVDVFS